MPAPLQPRSAIAAIAAVPAASAASAAAVATAAPAAMNPAVATASSATATATAAALLEQQRFDEAFVFWHARYADDAPAALAALTALARRAVGDHRHQLAASYDAIHCALRRGSRWYPAALGDRLLAPPQAPVSSARLRHDAMQFQYLHQLGVLGDEFPPIIARLRLLAGRLEAGQPHQREFLHAAQLDDRNASNDLDDVYQVYDRIVHLRPTPCVAQALSRHVTPACQQPGIVVIDDVLSAAALAELLRFCQQSTVWLRELGHGRLGATYDNGFNCPLLVQLRQLLDQALGPGHALLHLGACKHPPRLPGEALHADQGDLKLQLWLTPDAANLDPATGGMFIRAADGNTRYIGYRQNRAVMFPARLLHGAAARNFRDDHAGRRIDITLLYAAQRYSTPSARKAAIASSS